eukprot:TRINITY_DN1736_c0_g1_i1.p1 TRINITY_DN1736_c0_g1~~TRINITY_DN1736_c0_g1_i1.p1  ORF type:complete len:865 (-),score=267.51 TRINITY_DN1736_c0_g1_i1:60-2654(-)
MFNRSVFFLAIVFCFVLTAVDAQFIQSCNSTSWPIICCGDGRCSSPLETIVNCPRDCTNFKSPVSAGTGSLRVFPNECGPNCCNGTASGLIFGDNYWKLWVNGKFVKEDPISFVPHQAVKFTFTADPNTPREYAVLLKDYMQDSSGLEYNGTQLGDGGFRAIFSDGTISSSDWKCQVINYGPDPYRCCDNWNQTKACSGKGQCCCQTTNLAYDDNWYTSGYNFSSWAKAKEYTTDELGWGTPPLFNPLNSTCIVAVPGWEYVTPAYTTPDECKVGPLENFGNAKFIWGQFPIQDNHLLCRYTTPTAPKETSTSTSCPLCTAKAPSKRRVRREIRSLSAQEWQRVVDAMWIMRNTSTEAGVLKYGSAYKEYDYFVSKHAVTTTDSRGDQGHFSAAFITWHSVFLLEFENSLLAVDPNITGLPYWDSSIPDPSVYSPQYFGSVPGTGPNNQVIDGKFARWPVTKNWTLSRYSKYLTGNTVGFQNSDTGYLRNKGNTNANPTVTRFGKQFQYNRDDFIQCTTLQGYWSDWYECIELGTVRGQQVAEAEAFSHHSGPHLLIGGLSGTQGGDFLDVVTSPNEPMFMFHHANMDRSKMWYMANNYNKENICWGYPVKNASSVPGGVVYAGINLNDAMATAWGFTAKDLGLGNSTNLVTHADALCYLSVNNAPYVYADMQADPMNDTAAALTILSLLKTIPEAARRQILNLVDTNGDGAVSATEQANVIPKVLDLFGCSKNPFNLKKRQSSTDNTDAAFYGAQSGFCISWCSGLALDNVVSFNDLQQCIAECQVHTPAEALAPTPAPTTAPTAAPPTGPPSTTLPPTTPPTGAPPTGAPSTPCPAAPPCPNNNNNGGSSVININFAGILKR